jgi:glycosyltransferase involved in cell wall biosynthesis
MERATRWSERRDGASGAMERANEATEHQPLTLLLRRYYQAADWVANASDFETFGNTSYEANSVGTPCILHPKGGHLSQIAKEGTFVVGEGVGKEEGFDDDI